MIAMQSNYARAPNQRSHWMIFGLAWLVIFLMSATWAIATPIGGAPDEPAHLIKAASVARGLFLGTTTANGQLVHVPAYVAYTPAQTCYARNEQVTAACSAPLKGDPGTIVDSVTTAGLYNPLYYMLVGWPTLLVHNDVGIYLMRLASALLSSLFLAAALMMISTWKRQLLPLLGFAVATTPMVFFLNGVVNPNSVETTATLAVFVGVISMIRSPKPGLTLQRSMIVLVSAAVAVNMRGLSPLWVAIALLAPFILTSREQIATISRSTAVRAAVIGVLVATAAAMYWTVISNSLGAGINDPNHSIAVPGVGGSPIRGFAQIFVGTFDYGQGLVGVFGWLDTPAPAAVFFTWSALIGGLVLASVVALRGRALILALVLTGGLVLLPALTQAAYITGGGIIWQGRYALPLFVCVMVGLATLLSDRMTAVETRGKNRLVWLVLSGWTLAQVFALAFTLKRYGVGAVGTSWKRFLLTPEWSPPGGTILGLVACVVIFIGGSYLFGRLALARNGREPEPVVATRAGVEQ